MRLRSALLLFPWLLALALFAGCNGQSEGQVCSTDNGSSDCGDGLTCTAGSELGVMGARCCPSDRTQATTAVCSVHQNGIDADTSAPPLDASQAGDVTPEETGSDDASPQDAGLQDAAMTDGAASASIADAPADGLAE
jgi:hypothetical protein